MSYVKIDKETIIKLSSELILSIFESRKLGKEALIKFELEKDRKSWFRKLFKIKVITREKAISNLSGRCIDNLDISDFDEIDMRYYQSEQISRKLLNAAEKSTDGFIYISIHDLSIISS